MIPAKFCGFFLQLNIQIKSQELFADEEFFFFYKITRRLEKEEKGKHLPGEMQEMECLLTERERKGF